MLSLPLLLTLMPWAARPTMAADGAVVSTGAGRVAQTIKQPHGVRAGLGAADQGGGDEHAFITVRELMRLEGEQALAAARRRREQGPGLSPQSLEKAGAAERAGAPEAPRLVGIYGVGKRLFAEVRSGSQAWLFLNGHSLPVGRAADAGLYRLREMSGACVRLERRGTETLLCLPRAGRQ